MGFLSVLKKIKQKEKEIRILMLGLDNSGKTTILKRLCGEDINSISPTLGFNIKTLEYDGYKLNIWDVGGQKTIRTYWRNYFEQTDGVIWVIDSADKRRIDDCRKEFEHLVLEERLAGATVLLICNKSDIDGCMSVEEISEKMNLQSCNMSHHWGIFKASAVLPLEEGGITAALSWLIKDIETRIRVLVPKNENNE
ncbi:hypothetical protein WA158_003991 [Blastocystis sp. Blastoise]